MILNNRRNTRTLLPFGAKFFLVLLVSGFVLILSSCDKSSPVGLDVQPKNDILNVGYQDSTTLVTRTVKEDSLRTDQGLITSGLTLLGKYNDPIFGMASSSLYAQLSFNSNIYPTSFGTNPHCDSLVMILDYTGNYYGENNGRTAPKKQTINVYPLLDNMSTSVSYYSDTTLHYIVGDDLVNGYTFTPEIPDSTYAEGAYTYPFHKVYRQVRIPIKNSFGQTLINDRLTNLETSNAAFYGIFKGLLITAENTSGLGIGDGRIIAYSLPGSKVRLYYNYLGLNYAGTADSLRHTYYDLKLNLGSLFSHFNTTSKIGASNSTDLNTQVKDTNRTHSYSTTYIQSLAGVKTKIYTPYLMNMVKNGPIAINKAELVVNVVSPSTKYDGTTYTPPATLYLFGINNDGTSYVLPDLISAPYYYYGGFNAGNYQYSLNITRYIQQVLDKKLNNNGMYLLVPHISAATTASRVAIGGAAPKNPDGSANAYQMKLEITYTKLH